MMNVKQQTFYQSLVDHRGLSNKDVQALVKNINNKTGISQRRLARRSEFH